MPDFSTILQAPEVRALVQQNILERAFHDSLFPRMLFRGEATPVVWPANVGDTMVFTGVGLIKPKMNPLTPGSDPVPSDYQKEQWSAQLQQYADTIDSHMPSSIVAIASLFYRNAQQLGLSAGQTMNRLVRNRLYNAALSGMTVAVGGTQTGSTLNVARLNGFTTARRPDLAAGSPVQFADVSASNPLQILVYDNSAWKSCTVTGYTPVVLGDRVGPGSLTITETLTSTLTRAIVMSLDRAVQVNVGGLNTIDGLTSSNILRLQDIRTAVNRMRQENVPAMADGRYHCHLDPTSEGQVYQDTEWQRLLVSMPDYYMYREYAIGEILGCVYFRNTECPQVETVYGASTSTFDQGDNFAGELSNAGGYYIHRPLVVGQQGIYEYYQDLDQLITEAGVTGKTGNATITNNGIEVSTDRVQLIIRSPLNRLQDMVATSWKFIGDWPVRTDVTTGDAARFKRVCAIVHAS